MSLMLIHVMSFKWSSPLQRLKTSGTANGCSEQQVAGSSNGALHMMSPLKGFLQHGDLSQSVAEVP